MGHSSSRTRRRFAEHGVRTVRARALRRAGTTLTLIRRWSELRTWRAVATLAVWLGMSYAIAVTAVFGLLLSLVTVPIIGLGVAVRASVLRLLVKLIGLDRDRIEQLTRARLPPLAFPPSDADASFLARQRAWARAPSLWRLLAYEFVRIPVATALAFGAVAWWWAMIACVTLVVNRAELAYQPVHVLGVWFQPTVMSWVGVVSLLLACVVGLLLWPTAVRTVPAIGVALARWLLGPSPTELSQEVVRLSDTRAQAVAAADAERRRIERDLHDGLQPQLVNLALNLGLARSRLSKDPDAAHALLDRAHEEAKRAAEDLRNLVRGIHPSVLDERGLDAAFSALAASSSVPLQIDVHLLRRPSREAEVIAYYVVAEAITNINKHAHARTAMVTVSAVNDSLRVLVQDDGQGGACAEPGGGLFGLAARIAGVDGTFSLTSPDGGPTRIEAMIPCGW